MKMTRKQAIKAKCLDCCCGSAQDVRKCELKDCPIWIYRNDREENENDLRGSETHQKVMFFEHDR